MHGTAPIRRKTHVLFVDDDPNLLRGQRRMLHGMRDEWEMTFVHSGAEALIVLKDHDIDVLVTDMRMPGMNGAELLNQVSHRHPGVIRIVLSGYAENDTVASTVGTSHQYLDKPCNAQRLIETVRRSLKVRDTLRDDRLKACIAGFVRLPSRPSIYQRFVSEMQNPNATTATIAAIIEDDVALAAKILKLTNSAYFGMPIRVTDCRQAVQLIGLDTMRSVVALWSFFAEYEGDPVMAETIERLGRRSVRIGAMARDIMAAEGADREVQNQACAAGLLCHVGSLLLAANRQGEFSTACQICETEGLPIVDAERMVIGATHAELGAYLLGLWGFPDTIVEAVAFHHGPAECGATTFGPAGAVHVAQALVRASGTDEECMGLLDMNYLEANRKACRIAQWRSLVQHPLENGDVA